MDWRNIGISLQANVAPYIAGLRVATDRTREFTNELVKTSDLTDRQLTKIGHGATLMAGALVAGFGIAVGASMDFERTMSEVGAVSDATGTQLERLSQAALKAGADTSFSANEAAQAEAELAKAGVSVADVLGGALRGSLDLAAAGGLEVAQAAEIASTAMVQFGLAGSDVGHVADLLAAGANKSAADVGDLGYSLKYAGLAAAGLGIPIEDVVGTLGAFASNALKGEQAGTTLRMMLTKMADPTKEAKAAMAELGISFFDASGKFIGLAGVADQLRAGLSGLTDQQRAAAFSTLFTSEAAAGAKILYEQGAAGVRKWTDEVNVTGYASDIAARKLDNLSGDIEAFKGSVETGLIQTGSKANGALRSLVQGATDVVNGFGAMPDALQVAGLSIAGLGTAALGTIGFLATMKPKLDAMHAALEASGKAGQFASANMSRFGMAAAGAAIGIGIVSSALAQAAGEADKMWAELEKGADTGSIAGLVEMREQAYATGVELQKASDANQGFGNTLKGAGELMTPFGNSVADSHQKLITWGESFDALDAQVKAVAFNIGALGAQSGLSDGAVEALARTAGIDLSGSLDQISPKFLAVAEAQKHASSGALDLGSAIVGMTDDTKTAKEQLDAFNDAIDVVLGKAFSQQEAWDRLDKAMSGMGLSWDQGQLMAGTVSKVGGDFDGTTDAALAYRDAMRQIIEDGAGVVSNMKAQGSSAAEMQVVLGQVEEKIRNAATVWGIPQTEVDKYLSALREIPIADTTTKPIEMPGLDTAIAGTSQVVDALNKIKEGAHGTVYMEYRNAGAASVAPTDPRLAAAIQAEMAKIPPNLPLDEFAFRIDLAIKDAKDKLAKAQMSGRSAGVPTGGASDQAGERGMATTPMPGPVYPAGNDRLQQRSAPAFRSSGGGGGELTLTVNFPNYIGSPRELEDHMARELPRMISKARQRGGVGGT